MRSLDGCRILWVDDRALANSHLVRSFRSEGAAVVTASSNEEAVSLAREGNFHLVISDIDHGDEEEGSELGLRLWAAGCRAPVIHYVARIERDQPLPVGAVAITNDPTELIAAVYTALGRPIPTTDVPQ